jgi:integral membrane protein (TIGR00529 family)
LTTPLLHGLTAFIVAYTLLVIASSRGVKAFYSILIMVVAFAVLAGTPGVIGQSTIAFFSWRNVRAIIVLYLSLLTAGLLKEVGVLDRLLKGVSRGGCRFGGLAVPSLVGLLPMPGGALVSAIIVKDRYLKELRLGREEAVYLNYWFRHIWVPVWPLFQSLILTAAILGVTEGQVIRYTWPASIASIIAGIIVAWLLLKGKECKGGINSGSWSDLAYGLWPFILIAILVMLLDISMIASLTMTLILASLYYRPSKKNFENAVEFASRPTILGVLILSLFFKELLVRTSAPEDLLHLATTSGLHVYLIAYLVTFIAGLAAGGENFFAATAIPLLLPFIEPSTGAIAGSVLLAAYTGGYLGVMMSPVHLCLALTVEYFKARMSKSLLYTFATVLIASLLVFTYLFTIG